MAAGWAGPAAAQSQEADQRWLTSVVRCKMIYDNVDMEEPLERSESRLMDTVADAAEGRMMARYPNDWKAMLGQAVLATYKIDTKTSFAEFARCQGFVREIARTLGISAK